MTARSKIGIDFILSEKTSDTEKLASVRCSKPGAEDLLDACQQRCEN